MPRRCCRVSREHEKLPLCRGRYWSIVGFPIAFENHGSIPLQEGEPHFLQWICSCRISLVSPRPFLYGRGQLEILQGFKSILLLPHDDGVLRELLLVPSFPDASKIVFRSLETSPAATFLRADDASIGMESLRSAVKEAACNPQVGLWLTLIQAAGPSTMRSVFLGPISFSCLDRSTMAQKSYRPPMKASRSHLGICIHRRKNERRRRMGSGPRASVRFGVGRSEMSTYFRSIFQVSPPAW